jgi:hypothetical protein
MTRTIGKLRFRNRGKIFFLFLGLDTYLVHAANGTIRSNEWTPIIFSPIAGGLLLLAGLIALRRRSLATVIATLTLLASIGVGLVGAYLHFVRGILPTAPAGQQITVDLLVWVPPVLGPLMFSVVGILGISAAWIENPPNSGILALLGGRFLQLPYPKTQAYFYIVGMAALATLISSVLDHARLNFEHPSLWLPTATGIFGTVVAVTLGAIDKPTRADLIRLNQIVLKTKIFLINDQALHKTGGLFLYIGRKSDIFTIKMRQMSLTWNSICLYNIAVLIFIAMKRQQWRGKIRCST